MSLLDECDHRFSPLKYSVQKHGCGEGRLPIPDIIIKDKEDTHDTQQHMQPSRRPPAHKAAAGKLLLRAAQMQAQQQLDTVKAHRSAAKAFSAAVDRRNAERLRHGSTPAAAEGASPAAAQPQVSRQASLSGQHLVERHMPLRDAATEAITAQTPAAGADAPAAEAGALAAPPAGTAAASVGSHGTEAAADADAGTGAAVVKPAAAAVLEQLTAVPTFLTDPGQLPASPVGKPLAGVKAANSTTLPPTEPQPQPAAAVAAIVSDGGMVQQASAATGAEPLLCADTSSGCDVALVTDAHGSCGLSLPNSINSSSSAATGGPACEKLCSSMAAANNKPRSRGFTSADASCRLLQYTCGGAGSAQAATAVGQVAASAMCHEAAAAAGSPKLPAAAAGPQSWGPGRSIIQRAVSPRQVVLLGSPAGSPHRRQGPCWSPVPPRTQLQPPVVVRPMCEQNAMGQQQQQQQELKAPTPNQPPQQGVRDTPAFATQPMPEPCSSAVSKGSSRRVSGSSAAGKTSAALSTHSRRVPAAAFSTPELDQMATAAAEKVSKGKVLLPALCSCRHGTSPLDPTYPQKCCSNCPMRDQAMYEQLLVGMLAGLGLD